MGTHPRITDSPETTPELAEALEKTLNNRKPWGKNREAGWRVGQPMRGAIQKGGYDVESY